MNSRKVIGYYIFNAITNVPPPNTRRSAYSLLDEITTTRLDANLKINSPAIRGIIPGNSVRFMMESTVVLAEMFR